jgi:hypothetical protein
MLATIIRICAWFTMIIFSLTSIAGLIMVFNEKVTIPAILTFIVCSVMSITGWYARKFGLSGFKVDKLSKLLAVISLIFGIIFIVFVPLLFGSISGLEDSFVAIRNLFILFLPVVFSAFAILLSNSRVQLQ